MRDNGGLTLIELLVAITISFVIFLGLSYTGIFVLNQNLANSMRDEAVGVADNAVQGARRSAFDDLAGLDNTTQHEFRRIRGLNVDYAVHWTVTSLDADHRQATVTVRWDRTDDQGTKSYSHQVSTIMRRR